MPMSLSVRCEPRKEARAHLDSRRGNELEGRPSEQLGVEVDRSDELIRYLFSESEESCRFGDTELRRANELLEDLV